MICFALIRFRVLLIPALLLPLLLPAAALAGWGDENWGEMVWGGGASQIPAMSAEGAKEIFFISLPSDGRVNLPPVGPS